MTDRDLVAKKLAEIERYVEELRSLARLENLATDVREERFVAHTLQLAIQALIDVASHIVADNRLGEPETLADLFEILARREWIPMEMLVPLRRMAGFRNLLVHEYAVINLDTVRRIVEENLDDCLAFVTEIRFALDL